MTLYMSAAASVLLLLLCAASGDFAVPQTGTGWIGFGAAAVFYGFAQGVFVLILWREGGSPEGQRTHNFLPGKTCYATAMGLSCPAAKQIFFELDQTRWRASL